MVLLTAIKNFRQYQTKKSTSNALSFVDLSSVCVIDQCTTSSQVGVDRDMELERYHAAFPALGAAVNSDYLHHFDLSSVDSRNLDTCQLGAGSHINGTVTNGFGTARPKQHNNHHRHLKLVHSKDKSHLSNPSNDNHYGNGYYKRTSRHFTPKAKRVSREKPVEKKCSENQKKSLGNRKKLDLKPWKHLDPVDVDDSALMCTACPSPGDSALMCTACPTPGDSALMCTACPTPGDKGHGDSIEAVDNNPLWISDEVLQAFLTEDTVPDTSQNEKLQDLWDKTGKESAAAVWDFDDFVSRNQPCLTEEGKDCTSGDTYDLVHADSEQIVTDYSAIEQRMAALSFCEDIPDTSKGSRLMPLFRENPFSYMISNSRSSVTEAGDAISAFPSLSCKHCQEAYEVVLDLELSADKKVSGPGLLGEIDCRLNFDWCKYDPPSWATNDQGEADKPTSLNCRYSCDCQFCRSRSWLRTCGICGTPI